MESVWTQYIINLKNSAINRDDIYSWSIRHQLKPGIRLIIFERDPLKIIKYLFAALMNRSVIFLGNPDWTLDLKKQAIDIAKPNIIIESDKSINNSVIQDNIVQASNLPPNTIIIPTGSASNGIRFAVHSWETLSAASENFKSFFQIDQINSCCVLPLYHVSGLMQLVRSITTDGNIIFADYKPFLKGSFPKIDAKEYFLSLVPTQLKRLVENENSKNWISKFKTVIIGGACASDKLLEDARKAKIKISNSYGLTETAGLIAAQKPDNFLAGDNSVGKPLPDTSIKIISNQTINYESENSGLIKIKTPSLFHGYFPNCEIDQKIFLTNDIGELDFNNNLNIIGRSDRIINTGGEKVDPIFVEQVILQTKLVEDIWVTGIDDPDWGQSVCAIISPVSETFSKEKIIDKISDKLTTYKIPKKWISVDSIPRNAVGKIDIVKIKAITNMIS